MSKVTTVDTEWGVNVRYPISEEKTMYFSGFDREHAQKRALVFESLNERCEDDCGICRNSIPTEIACMGRAAIAAYIFSVHGESYKEIAARLDVAQKTVEQYISDFRHNRR